ncbi:Retrovirus-related Pol polyprotein from transposon RE1 [Linum grandiflorum]
MILNVSSSSSASSTWIVDSGATDHVVSSASLFQSSYPVANRTVTLPNGFIIPITRIGSVVLSPDLVLHNVLLIPAFRFNLLSVSRLVTQSPYVALFSSTSCLLQDVRTSRTIGSAECCNGLYYLRSFPAKSLVSALSSHPVDLFDLWHFRCGHSSSDSLYKAVGRKVPTSFHCNICPVAKQRRL